MEFVQVDWFEAQKQAVTCVHVVVIVSYSLSGVVSNYPRCCNVAMPSAAAAASDTTLSVFPCPKDHSNSFFSPLK